MERQQQRQQLRLLLLQIRDEPRVRAEELASFARYTGLEPSQIEILNVFDTPNFPASAADGYDGLFVGGASEASVLEPEIYRFLEPSQRLLLRCLETEMPVFASCFGFQLATVALGGTIIRDDRDFEMGTISIQLTDTAPQDPLFHDAPDPFMAVAVHRERAIVAPEGCQPLAYTSACCHAFRVEGKPFWAFQFHPEVDRATLVQRLTIYKQAYTENDDHLQQVLDSAVETPDSNDFLAKFVDRILLNRSGI
ncbi:MAG: aminotransferase [Alkalinema sp. CACIAM 70d]|nr:MAG: aminotransferase [Alkalinema sp. CACIAM 70d]